MGHENHLGWDKETAEKEIIYWATHPGPQGDAYWLVKAAGGDICVVLPQIMEGNSQARPVFYPAVPGGSGLWSDSSAERYELLMIADEIAKDRAFDEHRRRILDGEMTAGQSSAILQKQLRHMAGSPETRIRHAGTIMQGVVEALQIWGDADGGRAIICRQNEMDGNRRYLGFLDGVYDLREARFLSYPEAREALVSRHVGCRSTDMPETRDDLHPDVRMLLYREDMSDELMSYVRQSLAWSLSGRPAQRYNLLTDVHAGRGNAGKTTLLSAVEQSLGSYGRSLELSAMQVAKPGAATPELAPLATARFAWTDEANAQKINSERYKRMTGSGAIVYRFLYQNYQSGPLTASLFGASNMPIKLDLTDEAEKRRYRPIPIPEIPPEQRIESLEFAFADDTDGHIERRGGLLSVLLYELHRMSGPPEPPQAVLDLADAHQRESDGQMGEWARENTVNSSSIHDRVGTRMAWDAYCAMVPGRESWETQGHLTKMISRIRGESSRTVRIDGGRPEKGWVRLQLSDEAIQALDAGRQARQDA